MLLCIKAFSTLEDKRLYAFLTVAHAAYDRITSHVFSCCMDALDLFYFTLGKSFENACDMFQCQMHVSSANATIACH